MFLVEQTCAYCMHLDDAEEGLYCHNCRQWFCYRGECAETFLSKSATDGAKCKSAVMQNGPTGSTVANALTWIRSTARMKAVIARTKSCEINMSDPV